MPYIEPHGHMVSRTTDDYEKLALAGCVAICEPAFWAGFDRASADGFYDYFRQITEYEPETSRKVWPATLLMALHQSQGSGGSEAGGGCDGAHTAVSRGTQCARHWRNRPEQKQPERTDDSGNARSTSPRITTNLSWSTPHIWRTSSRARASPLTRCRTNPTSIPSASSSITSRNTRWIWCSMPDSGPA